MSIAAHTAVNAPSRGAASASATRSIWPLSTPSVGRVPLKPSTKSFGLPANLPSSPLSLWLESSSPPSTPCCATANAISRPNLHNSCRLCGAAQDALHHVRDTPRSDHPHESLLSPQRPPRDRQACARGADRRRQIRLDVLVAGAAHSGIGGAGDRRSRSGARTRGLPDRRLGRHTDRGDHFHERWHQGYDREYRGG